MLDIFIDSINNKRTCKKCLQIKPIKLFSKSKFCKYGYTHTCLDCTNKYAKARYHKVGRKKFPNICSVCGNEFLSVRNDRKFCSNKCISTGENNGRWKGGKYINSDGYVLIYSPFHPNTIAGKYVLEHRLVIEKKIERFLDPKESVHHINGNKSDNRLKNLMLFKTESEHQKYHKK